MKCLGAAQWQCGQCQDRWEPLRVEVQDASALEDLGVETSPLHCGQIRHTLHATGWAKEGQKPRLGVGPRVLRG